MLTAGGTKGKRQSLTEMLCRILDLDSIVLTRIEGGTEPFRAEYVCCESASTREWFSLPGVVAVGMFGTTVVARREQRQAMAEDVAVALTRE